MVVGRTQQRMCGYAQLNALPFFTLGEPPAVAPAALIIGSAASIGQDVHVACGMMLLLCRCLSRRHAGYFYDVLPPNYCIDIYPQSAVNKQRSRI